MSDDIDYNQDPRYHMSRRTLFYPVPGTWVRIGLDGSTCSESPPMGTCHFEPPEYGPNLHPGVRAGSLRATEQRAREKTRGRKRKSAEVPKNIFIHSNIYDNVYYLVRITYVYMLTVCNSTAVCRCAVL